MCEVDHKERREMGLLGCYGCGEDIQTIDAANEIRLRLGKRELYGTDRILRSSVKPCSVCGGTGLVRVSPEVNG